MLCNIPMSTVMFYSGSLTTGDKMLQIFFHFLLECTGISLTTKKYLDIQRKKKVFLNTNNPTEVAYFLNQTFYNNIQSLLKV